LPVPGATDFAPRMLYGRYLGDRREGALRDAAACGITVSPRRGACRPDRARSPPLGDRGHVRARGVRPRWCWPPATIGDMRSER